MSPPKQIGCDHLSIFPWPKFRRQKRTPQIRNNSENREKIRKNLHPSSSDRFLIYHDIYPTPLSPCELVKKIGPLAVGFKLKCVQAPLIDILLITRPENDDL